MTLKDQLPLDLPVFFDEDEFAKSVDYGTPPVPIIAIVDFGEDLSISGKMAKTAGSLIIKASDVPAPKFGDKVVIDTIDWTIEKVSDADDGLIFLLDIRREEKSVFGGK